MCSEQGRLWPPQTRQPGSVCECTGTPSCKPPSGGTPNASPIILELFGPLLQAWDNFASLKRQSVEKPANNQFRGQLRCWEHKYRKCGRLCSRNAWRRMLGNYGRLAYGMPRSFVCCMPVRARPRWGAWRPGNSHHRGGSSRWESPRTSRNQFYLASSIDLDKSQPIFSECIEVSLVDIVYVHYFESRSTFLTSLALFEFRYLDNLPLLDSLVPFTQAGTGV